MGKRRQQRLTLRKRRKQAQQKGKLKASDSGLLAALTAATLIKRGKNEA